MTRDGTPVKKPTLKMDLDLHDPARNSKLNNKWAKMFFPAEVQRKKKYKKWEKEVGMDLTGEYNPMSKQGGRRSEMYNNPFPWLRKANQLKHKAKNQMNTITGKLKDKVDVKYDRIAYKIYFHLFHKSDEVTEQVHGPWVRTGSFTSGRLISLQ